MNTSRMRIAFITPFLFRFQRGIERSCIHLANELVRSGQKITIIAWDEASHITATPLDRRIRVVRVPRVPYFRAQWAIPFYVRELLTRRYDVVNVYFAGYGEAEALTLASRFRPVRFNFIVGYPFELVPHRFHEFLRCGLAQRLDSIIVKSPPMAPAIAAYFGREVLVIPNGVDTDAFDPESVNAETIGKRLGLRPEDRVLVTVAALQKRKGIHHVIRALPALLKTGIQVRYVVVGDGPGREQLEREAAARGVAQQVHFVGNVTNVLPYYKLADVFVLTSHGEGFPNVLLEAWSMGLPAVVSCHPPYPEIMRPEVGCMVDETNLSELASALQSLLTCAETRLAMGRNSRNHVLQNYGWAAVASRYFDAFNQQARRGTVKGCPLHIGAVAPRPASGIS